MIEIRVDGYTLFEMTTPKDVAYLRDERDAIKADAELGRIAMRFVDRAGDPCEDDPAYCICTEFHKAMCDQITKGTS